MRSTTDRRGKYQHPFGGQAPKYVARARAAQSDDIDKRKVIASRKDQFDEINRMCMSTGGAWLTSIPGDIEVTMDCIPGSEIPDELRELGYHLVDAGRGQRIVPDAITERFGRQADGSLVPLVAGSTLPVVHRVTHGGIVETRRWSFSIG